MSSLSGHVDFSSFEPLHSRVENSDPVFFWSGNGIYFSSKRICLYSVLNIYSSSTHTHILSIYTDIFI